MPGPIDKSDYLQIQGDFFEAFLGQPESEHKLDFRAYSVPNTQIPPSEFSRTYFRRSLDDYSRNLISLLNRFCTGTNRLAAWDMIFSDESRELSTRLYILVTLIQPHLLAWIATPYVFQQRIAVCTIFLLNDWAVISDSSRREVDETKFRFNWLSKQKWLSLARDYGVDLPRLHQVFSRLGTTSIGELRHAIVHRYPPEFGYGSSKLFVRSPTGSSVGLSGNAPIKLGAVVKDLRIEQEYMRAAFLAFWDEFEALARRSAS